MNAVYLPMTVQNLPTAAQNTNTAEYEYLVLYQAVF